MRKGYGYLGSNAVKTSTSNQEIIPSPPVGWSTDYHLYKFQFINYSDTNVIINGKTNLFLKANQGFETDINDANIYSFVITEADVDYQWVGAY